MSSFGSYPTLHALHSGESKLPVYKNLEDEVGGGRRHVDEGPVSLSTSETSDVGKI